MAQALHAADAEVHYQELAEAGHNVRDSAYADGAQWRWLASVLEVEP